MADTKAKTIYEALANIQKDLHVGKDKVNKFGGFNYRSAEDILEKAKPLAAKQGCCVHLTDEVVLIGDRFYIKSTASVFNNEGASINAVGFAREETSQKGKDQAQTTGSASSYARKFALAALFGIDDGNDADAQQEASENEEKPTKTEGVGKAPKAPSIPSLDDALKELAAAQNTAQVQEIYKKYRDTLGKTVIDENGKEQSSPFTIAARKRGKELQNQNNG